MKRSYFMLAIVVVLITVLAGCRKHFTVIFDSNDGRDVPSLTVIEGDTVSEPTVPVKKDYILAGWFTGNDILADKWDFANNAVAADITLHAKWWAVKAVNEIHTAGELDAVRNYLSGSYILMNDISLAKYENWEPIGTDTVPFTGRFEGNRHKISDLRINRPQEDYAGLFGSIKSCYISDLGVEIAKKGITARVCSGGIAGNVYENATITGCYSSGNIIAKMISGGIAGYVHDYSTISNCYSTGSIMTTTTYPECSSYAGGIAGSVTFCTITNCYSTGDIIAYTLDTSSSHIACSGGIAGRMNGCTVTDCYSMGNIAAVSPFPSTNVSYAHYSFSGGIAGNIESMGINNCYSTGNISSSYFSGGIGGFIHGGVNNCCSSGNISSTYAVSGGIAGTMTGTITNCYGTGNISSGYSSGGIVGILNIHSEITNCYSTGNIFSYHYAGGIAGRVYGNNTITNCVSINSTIDADRIGRITCSIDEPATISNNFALTNMITTGTRKFDITDTKYDGVSKPIELLQTQAIYSDPVNGDGLGGLGWNFTSTWKMTAGSGYPLLAKQLKVRNEALRNHVNFIFTR